MPLPLLRTPEDIRALGKYVSHVDPDVTPLNRIIEPYYVKPTIQCALCGTWHYDGFIIELMDGAVTNIGNTCGEKFGERYAEERRKYSEAVRKPQLLKELAEGIPKVQSMQFALDDRKYKSEQLVRRAEAFRQRFPAAWQELARRGGAGDSAVYESVERSRKEIEDILAANPYQSRESVKFGQQLRGRIAGTRFAALNWSYQQGLRRVLIEAEQFVQLQPRLMPMHELTRWSNWYRALEAELAL